MSINYITDIVRENDPNKRKESLNQLINERQPSEILVLMAISVLSDDNVIRKIALNRIDERNMEDGNASSRLISLIRSWRSEVVLMSYPKPMDYEQNMRATEIEAAYYAKKPLSSAVN